MMALYRYTLNTINPNNLNKTVFMGDVLWKYFPEDRFADLIEKKQLRLTVLQKWQKNDPFEGIFDEKQLVLRDAGSPQLSNDIMGDTELFKAYQDHFKVYVTKGQDDTKDLKAKMKMLEMCAFGASFHINDGPEQYMFDRYGPISIKTTTKRLEMQLERSHKNFETGRIEYIDENSWMPRLEVWHSVMFYKNKKDIDEREFRIFTIDEIQYAVNQDANILVSLDPLDLIEGIAIDPTLNTADRKRIKKMAKKNGIRVLNDGIKERLSRRLFPKKTE